MNSREIERITAEASRCGWYYTMPNLGQFVYFKRGETLDVNYQADSGTIVDAVLQTDSRDHCLPRSTTIASAHDADKLCRVLARLRGH